MTDESPIYPKVGKEFSYHGTVKPQRERVCPPWLLSLHRYLAEFDFRYNNRSKLGCEDAERAERALAGVVGKRLTYRTVHP